MARVSRFPSQMSAPRRQAVGGCPRSATFAVVVMTAALPAMACGKGEITGPGAIAPSDGDAGMPMTPLADGATPLPRADGGVIVPPVGSADAPLVFVSRQINDRGSVYWDAVNDMAGVGAHSRVRPAAPSRLLVREPDGTIRTLVDGALPTAASMQLIDVNGPAVSYDGRTIAFAGLPAGDYPDGPATTVGAWRIFAIDADGGNLRQVTVSDQDDLDFSQFGRTGNSLGRYDDYDPVFLPDGRICFSSTRWPSIGQYSGVRTSNLHVVNLDGTQMHRITAERNGADRPIVDPMTGKIVYARWWRNHRFPVDSMETIAGEVGGAGYAYDGPAYEQHEGLTAERGSPVGGGSMFRNAWQAATIAPDGTDLAMWAGVQRDEEGNHVYGGSFTADGVFFANFFPMYNMTEAGGFGGIRRYERGAHDYTPVIGITTLTLDYVSASNPTSYGIFHGQYAGDPEAMSDGKIIFSLATGVDQDYGLYIADMDGSNVELLYDEPGTQELRVRALIPRTVPPILPDSYRDDGSRPAASLLPPPADGPYDQDGTFTFAALNVYANGPVDMDIVSAVPVGSAGTIRFFIDHQRQSPGSFPSIDWPILLGETAISPAGAVSDENAPANVPLFEQLRTARADGYRVPLTGGPTPNGAAHVTGMNFGAPGAVARCVGCHAGHTLIPVPETDEEAAWSNLAPGASVRVSSTRADNLATRLIDRRVQLGRIEQTWTSARDAQSGQWAELTFPVPITVRNVRLYAPRSDDRSNLTLARATVRLFADAAGTTEVGSASGSGIVTAGTDVAFADVRARVVRVELDEVTGTFEGSRVAGLAEIEVIARGEAP